MREVSLPGSALSLEAAPFFACLVTILERTQDRPLVHRGGLRADILSDGLIRLGGAVSPTEGER